MTDLSAVVSTKADDSRIFYNHFNAQIKIPLCKHNADLH